MSTKPGAIQEAQREMRDIIKALRIEINGLKAMKVKLVSINESLEAELRMLRAIVDSKNVKALKSRG